jgi:hypothetical protein
MKPTPKAALRLNKAVRRNAQGSAVPVRSSIIPGIQAKKKEIDAATQLDPSLNARRRFKIKPRRKTCCFLRDF